MKRNKAFAVLMSTLVCVSLFTFGTYSMFSDNKSLNLSMKTDNFNVETSILNAKTNNKENVNKFNNGGFWNLVDGKLTVKDMLEGDSFSFDIHVKNNNNYPCFVKVYNNFQDGYDFFKNFDMYYGNNWIQIGANKSIDIPFGVKCNSNLNNINNILFDLGIKSTSLTDELENLNIQQLHFNNVELTNESSFSKELSFTTKEKNLIIDIPKERIIPNKIVTFKANNSDTNNFNVNPDSNCLIYDFALSGVNESSEKISTSIYVGRFLGNIKVHQLINGNDTIIKDEDMNYDSNTGILTFNSSNVNKTCIEILHEDYFTPLSTDPITNANDLSKFINEAENNSIIRLNYGAGDYNFSKEIDPLIIDNKNITLIGFDDLSLNSKFTFNQPIIVANNVQLDLHNINVNSDDKAFVAKDAAKINIYDSDFTASKKDVTLIESMTTLKDSTQPCINIYGGNYKAFENNGDKTLNPLLKTSKENPEDDLINCGNIYIYDGYFENFNPANVYYTYNNKLIHKSYLYEGTYCKNNKNEDYYVLPLVKNASILSKVYSDIFGICLGKTDTILLKANLWLSPFLAQDDTIEKMYCFNGIGNINKPYFGDIGKPCKYDFGIYTMNFALNDSMMQKVDKQNVKYYMLNENNMYMLSLNSSVETHKPAINPTIYSDNNDLQSKFYGLDVCPDIFALILFTGVYDSPNTFTSNQYMPVSDKNEDFGHPGNVYVSNRFMKSYFPEGIEGCILKEPEPKWDDAEGYYLVSEEVIN